MHVAGILYFNLLDKHYPCQLSLLANVNWLCIMLKVLPIYISHKYNMLMIIVAYYTYVNTIAALDKTLSIMQKADMNSVCPAKLY